MNRKRIIKKVDPLTGKASTADNVVTYGAFKTRKRRRRMRRMRNKTKLDQGVKRRRFSLKVNEGVGNKSMDSGDIIKVEVGVSKLAYF